MSAKTGYPGNQSVPSFEADPAQQLMHEGLASLHRASVGLAARAAGAAFFQDANLTVSVAAHLPDSAIVLNHGFVHADHDTVTDTVGRAAEIYRDAGVGRFFLSSVNALPTRALKDAGLVPARSWRLFSRALDRQVPRAAGGLEISRVDAGAASECAGIVVDAFDLGPAARQMLQALPHADGWFVFQAETDGQTVGTGALFQIDGYAWTDFGATAPAHRGKGVQTALLSHRIAFAASLGCHTIYTCTGEEVAGEPQISYRNILKTGFEEADLLFNYAPG